jgi:hypothetical protein
MVDPSTGETYEIRCKESSMLPTVDVLGGGAAIVAAGAGILLEQTSDDGQPKHFTAYYAGPLLAVAIAYFWSAGVGNHRLEKCSELKTTARGRPTPVRSIDAPAPPPPSDLDH